MAVGNQKSYEEMEAFWSSLPTRLKTILYKEARRLVLSSDEVPLSPVAPSRIRALPKYYLFSDVLVIIQGTILTEYPLEWVWLDHLLAPESLQQSPSQTNCFRLILPEINIDLQCKEFVHKSMWVSCIAESIGVNLNIPQFVNSRGDLTLDTQLQLIRGRDFIVYTYQTIPEMKDGRYKGPWTNGKPHGIGEYWHEPSGKLYKGGFKKGQFHGRGELLWFTDKEDKKKYIGEFTRGQMNGRGEMKFSNGDVYDGCWEMGKRCGFGTLEEASRKNSKYTGGWRDDKRNGYGVYDDRMRHERYLGMWVDNHIFGPGIIVTSTGTYCEATFSNGMATSPGSGNDGLILDSNGSSFMGKIGSGFRLAGKGVLTLSNGVMIEGCFAGPWNGSIEIHRGVLNSQRPNQTFGLSSTSGSFKRSHPPDSSSLQVARLDRRIGTCTVLASNKWQPIYEECEKLLGFSGNAASDVITAWSRIASGAFESRLQRPSVGDRYFQNPVRRASSLSVIPKTVRTPVQLIPLERARAQTIHEHFREEEEEEEEFGGSQKGEESAREGEGTKGEIVPECLKHSSLDDLEKSLLQMSIEHSIRLKRGGGGGNRVEISGPLHLQEDIVSSYPPATTLGTVHTPWVDGIPSSSSGGAASKGEPSKGLEEESVDGTGEVRDGGSKFDTTMAIQNYVDKAFNTATHPLGILMNNIEDVFRDSYGGIGANKYLLPHAISEVQYIIKRIHTIIRILFPFLDGNDLEISNVGFPRVGVADPEDYLCIESGYKLLHPLVFSRIFPTLMMLYMLHHVEEDRKYQHGVDSLSQMDRDRLIHYIRLPQDIMVSSPEPANGSIIQYLNQAARILQRINTLYTPGEFLDLFKSAFKQLSSIKNLSGDLLLPSVVYIVVQARVQHMGGYLHFLTDFAHTKAEDDYILVTYEAAYNFIQKQDSSILL